MGLFIDDEEHVGRAVHGFRRAEEEKAAAIQGEVEDLHHSLLRRAIEIDEKVATRNHVEMREGRVFDEVVMREEHHLAQLSTHAVAVRLFDKEAAQPLGRNVGHVRLRVETFARRRDGLLVYVGGEDLNGRRTRQSVPELGEHHRQRVGFLAGRAARHLDTQLISDAFALEESTDVAAL